MKVKVEFAGGSEILFDAKSLNVEIDDGSNITQLISILCDNHIKKDKHLFSVDGEIRPGILVLIDEVDFEVLGKYNYKLKPDDTILFVSTLHGG